jgi:DNA-binding transcriptional regulator YiaG
MVDLSTCETAVRVSKAKSKPTRWIDPEKFRIARLRAGLKQVQAADMLDVSVKTLRNWEESRSPVPYAAFRVMRLMGGYLLAGKAWEGWTLKDDQLFSPEGRSFKPHELRYISNYFTMARLFLKSRDSLKTQTPELSTAASEAASSVSPIPSASPIGTGTLTPAGAGPLRLKVVGKSLLPVQQEKTLRSGSDSVMAQFKSGYFVTYRPAANEACYG